jgi:hypothetical protein
MLTGQGLIAKLVELLATKLIGRQIDLALDERKLACRSLTELYFCLDSLERLTRAFTRELSEIEDPKDGWIVANSLANHGWAIELLSKQFIVAGDDLRRTLDIVDPVLATALEPLYAFKYSFLSFIGSSAEPADKDGERNRLIRYRSPDQRILTLDIDAYYEWLRQNPPESIVWDRHLEWPMSMMLGSRFEENFPQVEIEVGNLEAVRAFGDILITHGAALGTARELLRSLIAKNFKLEEVLFVSKDLPEDIGLG